MSAGWRPTQAELLEASARTAAAIANSSLALADVQHAAELEEILYSQLEPGPCDRPADRPPLESKIDFTPEIEAEAAELEAVP